MATMQEPVNRLDEAEATALAGMVVHDKVDAMVDATAFDHPGRRALVAHWERIGHIGLTSDDLVAAADAAGIDMGQVSQAVKDVEAMAARADSTVILRECKVDLVNRKEERAATESLRRVTADYDRGNLPTEAVAAAWQRLADAKRQAGRLMHGVDAGDFGAVLDRVMADLKVTHERGWLGLRLKRFKQLNGKLCGLRGLMLLGAAPGVGKTQLTLQLGIDAIGSDPDVGLVYLTLEMSKDELALRLLAIASKLRYRRLRLGDQALQPFNAVDSLEVLPGEGLKLSGTDRDNLGTGKRQLDALKSRIRLFDSADVGALAARNGDQARWYAPLAEMVTEAKRRMGVRQALVVIDNLQAIAVEPPQGRPWASDMDRDRVVIEGLTRLQHDTGDAVMVVSEVTKGDFDDTDGMKALLGTGRNAYRGDAVMLMKRKDKRDAPDADDRRLVLIIDKGRDGMERGNIELKWDADFMAIDEVGKA